MIAGISGTIRDIGENFCLVESGNFVITVLCSAPTLAPRKVGEAVFLSTFLVVREDHISLYGFSENSEKLLFEKLISVSGIGPKTALEILSVGSASVQKAIAEGDVAFLSGIKGIGKKTAARAIVELREKITEIPKVSLQQHPHFSDAEKVLLHLGFSAKEISERFKNIPDEIDSAEKIVEWFLRR